MTDNLHAMRIDQASWLRVPELILLAQEAQKRGAEVRFVGGCVRDAVLGRAGGDVDLATSLLPSQVIEIAAQLSIKCVPTGLAHGTVTLVIAGQPYEVTTLRRDVSTNGRHAEVAFTDSWQEDASRRDFTMNALYCDFSGRIYDFFGGVDDAQSGRVQFIGHPEARIREDVLRILRFFRFQAHYGQHALNEEGHEACVRLKELLPSLSRERVHHEIFKLLLAPRLLSVWGRMFQDGIFEALSLPLFASPQLHALVAHEHKMGEPAAPLRRLWAAVHPSSTTVSEVDIAQIAQGLALSTKEKNRLLSMCYVSTNWPSSLSFELLAHLAYAYGAEPVVDMLILTHDSSQELISRLRQWKKPAFPLSGQDLSALGVAPGPRMGELLRSVEKWWILADFLPNHAECLHKVKTLL